MVRAWYTPIFAIANAVRRRSRRNVTGFLAYSGAELRHGFSCSRKPSEDDPHRLSRNEGYLGRPVGRALRDGARRWGVTPLHVDHPPNSCAEAFARMTREPPDELFVACHPVNYANRQLIVDFAADQRMPGIYPYREVAIAGGLCPIR